jgi:hypothetical protein
MIMITYPDGQRTETEINHPNEAGFTGDGCQTRHSCGLFAAVGRKEYTKNGVFHTATSYKCYRCNVTVIAL